MVQDGLADRRLVGDLPLAGIGFRHANDRKRLRIEVTLFDGDLRSDLNRIAFLFTIIFDDLCGGQ